MSKHAFAFAPETYARLRARQIAAALADAGRHLCHAFQLCGTDEERRTVRALWNRCVVIQERFVGLAEAVA